MLIAKILYPASYENAYATLASAIDDYRDQRLLAVEVLLRAIQETPQVTTVSPEYPRSLPVLFSSRKQDLTIIQGKWEIKLLGPLVLGETIDLLITPKAHVRELKSWVSGEKLAGKLQVISKEAFEHALLQIRKEKTAR